MIKDATHRFLFIPIAFFIGFVVFFFVVEYRTLTNDDEMRKTLNDPLIELIFSFQNAAWKFEASLDAMHSEAMNSSDNANEEYLLALRASAEGLKKGEETLTNYFNKDSLTAEGYIKEIDLLRRLKIEILKIQALIPDYGSLGVDGWEEAEGALITLMNISHELSFDVLDLKSKNVAAILDSISKDEKQRAILSIFALLSVIVLVLVLLDAVYHYKSNAERARAAEQYNAMFAAALQNTRVGVLIRNMKDVGTPVVFINNAFTSMTGYKPEDVLGVDTGFLFGWNTDQTAIRAYHRAVQLDESITLDLMLYRKDGSPFWAEWNFSPLIGKDGRPDYFVSLFNDTTTIRQTQDELIQAKLVAEQASAIKTNFLAMMSHEIRTPINGVLGVLKLLEHFEMQEDQRHLLNVAVTSSHALHGIINDILDFAKIEAGRVNIYCEPFSLRKLFGEVAELSRSLIGEKKVELIIEVSDEVPDFLNGDSGRLRQIFLNLVTNAIKFTESGYVHVRALSLMQQEVDKKAGVLLRFEVQDTGIGISNEDQSKLFLEFSQIERSFTRSYGGTGLGLAICKRLIELMHGEIGVESQSGQGSKFWFMVPIQEGQIIESDEPVDAEENENVQKDVRHMKVLLAEDNDTNRLVARRYLEKVGLVIDEASHGEQAVELAKHTNYDLILMDVSMPVMDGLMATCRIRGLNAHNAQVPILALTAHAMEGDRQLCLAAGMNDYLNKPLEFNKLIRSLERWLHVRIEMLDLMTTTTSLLQESQTNGNSSQAPDFDQSVLASMKETLGPRAVEQVTRTFLSDSIKRLPALESDDIVSIRDTAHTLKSCSANCGLRKFSKLMESLERAAASDDAHGVKVLLLEVHPTYAAAREALEQGRLTFME